MPRKCIVMFSGGLDSVVATHLLSSQGLEVEALHFVLPFDAGLGDTYQTIRSRAERAGATLTVIEEGEEFLEVLRNPEHGYGKNVNPCIDCRIHRLRRAHANMRERGADFIATGEVIGQRPMSQRAETMRRIEKSADLEGLLLRPLSAKLMEPTIPEKEEWVDRGRLMDLQGRSRKSQLAYAQEHGLAHGTPGGGCILTDRQTAGRYHDLAANNPDYSVDDLRLMVRGRRFRLSPNLVLAVGRNEQENETLSKLVQPGDRVLEPADMKGPLAVARGEATDELIARCGSLMTRYAREAVRRGAARVRVLRNNEESTIDVTPATDEECAAVRVG